MAAAGIDTHRIVKRLREVGFSDEQAETVTDLLRETSETALADLATKSDIKDLRSEIQALRSEMLGEIQALRSELLGEIQNVETKLRSEIQALRSEMQLLEQRMTIKLGSMLVVAVGIMAALVKLL